MLPWASRAFLGALFVFLDERFKLHDLAIAAALEALAEGGDVGVLLALGRDEGAVLAAAGEATAVL